MQEKAVEQVKKAKINIDKREKHLEKKWEKRSRTIFSYGKDIVTWEEMPQYKFS